MKACWKQCGEWVTDFAHRYRSDIFFRTQWNIILLQIGFAITLLVLITILLSVLYKEVLDGFIESIVAILESGTTNISGPDLRDELQHIKTRSIVIAGSSVLAVMVVFSFLITRLALTPTKRALDAQKQFIGNVAHELRTPLSIIKTNTEVVLLDSGIDQETRRTLKSNIEELDRIADVTNNLLSMSSFLRPERMEFKNVDAGETARRVIKNLRELVARKNIHITLHASDEFRTVWANPSGLEQIIMNVVRNALNYTPAGGSVTIWIEPTYRGEIMITIEDTGIGIPRKDLYRIFEPFYRGDRSRKRKHGSGSGLGLAIVSELVKLHRGHIGIQSAPGYGTTVSIKLPCGTNERTNGTPKDDQREAITIDFSGGRIS